ncbi:hypothetical protein [Neptunomonas antarctica]|uniref:Uncharacterized protein n=1 Tax=Neptunomonas antarctica TaxID=619304 RepID=A0A1N7M078_9GAMM|nr:hypothetical protein [Neptunomonas antarctica]SIS79510.1 hypothetical protein SAMN05421760_10546 [Neptunomonas antarctica]
MSHDNNPLQVPDFGPADRSPTPAVLKVDVSEKNSHSEAPLAPAENRGGGLMTFILVLLTAVSGGLGYLGFGMQQTIVAQQQTLESASERINALEKLLNVASDSADKTDQTLAQFFTQITDDAAVKYTLYDSEIAKLWDVANKRNKNSIDLLSTEVKSLADRVNQTDKVTTKLNTDQQAQSVRITNAEKSAAALDQLSLQLSVFDKKQTALIATNSQFSKDQAALKKSASENTQSLKQNIATLQTQIAILDETLGEEQLTQQAVLKKLARRLSIVEQSQKSGGGNVESRVKTNEQAIRAIDGSRRQMNSDLMTLNKKLNALQLRIDKR